MFSGAESSKRGWWACALAVGLALLLVTAPEAEGSEPPVHLTTFGTAGSGEGEFGHPADVALDPDGDLWVVDLDNNRVQQFDPEGNFISEFGEYGLSPGQLFEPRALVVDAAGDIWVADALGRVQKFSPEGEPLDAFGGSGSEDGKFDAPQGIAIDDDGDIWVADTHNGRLQEFEEDGDFIRVVSSKGSGEGQLREPTGIDVDPEGRVWVADWWNEKVAVFNQAGELVDEFGGHGSGPGQFLFPDALAIDDEGRVFVGDEGNNRIQEFDEERELVEAFGSPGSGTGEFDFAYPMGLASDDDGTLWITDSENDRMQSWAVNGYRPASCENDEAPAPFEGELQLKAGGLPCEGSSLDFEIVAGPEHGEISGFSAATGALTYAPVAAYVGPDSFTFRAGNGLGPSATKTFTLDVTKRPVISVPPKIEGEPAVDAPMIGNAGAWQGVGEIDYAWQWLHCDAEGKECEEIPGAIEQDRLGREYDIGTTLRLEVTATNSFGEGTARSAPTPVIAEPDPPVNTEAPVFEGAMNVGEELQSWPGEWSHHPQSYSFQWQECDAEGSGCEDVEGATERTFQVPPAAEGGTVRVRVTAENRGGEATAASTVGSVVGPMVAPENQGRPKVPSPEETKEIEPDIGSWSGGRPRTFTYQWFLCNGGGGECTEIVGATQRTYTPGAEEVDSTLKLEVTATNAAGNASEISFASSDVDESESYFVGDVKIEGEAVEGSELSLDMSNLLGSEPMEVEYQWERCFERCVAIPSATAATYTLVANDVARTIRAKVTARNSATEEFDAVNKTRETDPVEPEETEGEPRLAEYPELDGYPRATELITSTKGSWRGAGEISTSVRWQRCVEGVESCEDIEGASGDSYEVEEADVGARLRSVVTATSEEGSAEAGSRMTPPVIAAENTLYLLDPGVTVQELLEAVEEAEVPIISLEYTGEVSGAYSAGIGGTKAQAVLEAIDEDLDPEALIVKSFTLAGVSPGGGEMRLWDPIDDLINAFLNALHNTPSHRNPDPPPDEENAPEPDPEPRPEFQPSPGPLLPPKIDEPREVHLGEPNLKLPIIEHGELIGEGWECLAEECEEFNPPIWAGPDSREVDTSFTWGLTPEDVLREIDEKVPLAFEFDVKLENPHGREGGLTGISCTDTEVDEFWITERDDKSWSGNIPEDAGPYWDTAKFDPCNLKDLSYGVYHPEELIQGRKYRVDFVFHVAGDAPRSGVQWRGELLERVPWPFGECDFMPWCVNIEPLFDDYRLPQVMIPAWYKWDFPRCLEYEYRYGLAGAHECFFPV